MNCGLAGSIGAACARLAKAYGMTVLALRRDTSRSKNDPHADVVCSSLHVSVSIRYLSDTVIFAIAFRSGGSGDGAAIVRLCGAESGSDRRH